jgi:hypothetical protein
MDAVKAVTDALVRLGMDVDATASTNTPTQTGAVLRVTSVTGVEFTVIVTQAVYEGEDYSDSLRQDEMDTAEDYNRWEENQLAQEHALEMADYPDDRESFGADSWQSDGTDEPHYPEI